MIKFFRKIRQKLLSENKFSKYLIYAIGEISLVMIGILLALQVNNWHESRKDNNQYKKYLNGLILDINADIDDLVRNETGNNNFKRKARNLMHIYQSDQNFEDLVLETKDAFKKGDTLLLLLSIQQASFMSAPTINKFAIEDIKSSGQTSIFKNENLKREIFEYYSKLERYEEWWQGKLRVKNAMDDIKFKLLDPMLLNLSNIDRTKRLEVMSNYEINPDDIIKGIRSHNDLLPPLNNMIYTMERISAENLWRTNKAKETLAKLEEEKDRVK
jgi:hypothetical protein